MRRAGETLEASIKLRDQLVGALAYPVFVLISTRLAAARDPAGPCASLEPLIDDSGAGGQGAPIPSALLAASRGLREQGLALVAGVAVLALLIHVLARAGRAARAVRAPAAGRIARAHDRRARPRRGFRSRLARCWSRARR